jgi:WD40 repeat protein/predicted Ser/Thr protein kinase
MAHCPACAQEVPIGSSLCPGCGAALSGSNPELTGPYQPVHAAGTTPRALHAADAIAGYKLLRELHRGGQGVVYQAVQEATKRKVALKVLLEGPFASPQSQRRFEREVELLGSLRHPYIVPVYDSGVCQGRFYYAMEYIRGERLTDHVQARRLSVSQTLRVFQHVCQAVDHAHQKGVIHRDLKPGNILVDEAGAPHVLDFGLAKAAGPEAAEASLLVSQTGQVMGTPAYMSPEQAAGRPDQVDLRSDVYALGVVLYELLTGQLPHDTKTTRDNLLRSIREVDPRRPRTLRRDLDDEVETIILKAMSKDKGRRYATAGMLGDDIGHYLAGEAIEAKRDSALYVLRKSLRRYKVPAAIILGAIVVVTAGLVAALALWRQAAFHRDRAVGAEQLAQQRLGEVEAARDESDRLRGQVQQKLHQYRAALAQRELESNQVGRLKELLVEWPQERRGWEWHRLNYLCDRSVQTLRGHGDRVTCVSYSPDGRHVASGSQDQTVRVWDVATGREVLQFPSHSGGNISLAYSPDGRLIVSASPDKMVRCWEAATGQERFPPLVHTSEVRSLAFVPKRGWIAAMQSDGIIRLWDASSGGSIRTLGETRQEYFKTSLAVSSDGRRLWSAHQYAGVRVWDLDTGEGRLVLSSDVTSQSLAVSPDGKLLACATGEGRILLRNLDTGAERALFDHGSHVWSLAVSPDGQLLASAGNDHVIQVWGVKSGKRLRTLRGHEQLVFSVDFSSDGRRVASASFDGTVKLWDAEGEEDVLTLHAPNTVFEAAFCAEGRYLVACDISGTIRLWDALTSEELRTFFHHRVTFVTASQDGKRLATRAMDGSVRLWDTQTGVCLHTFWGQSASANMDGTLRDFRSVAFGPEAGWLALAGQDFEIALTDTSTGKRLQGLRGHTGPVTNLAVSPDGARIASISLDKSLRLWEVSSGQELWKRPTDIRGGRSRVIFSPDGKRVMCGEGNGEIRVRSVLTGEELLVLRGHSGRVHSVAFSPDGRRIASCGIESSVRIWDAETGEELIALSAHLQPVQAVAFSPDGRSLVSGSFDGTVRLWETGPPAGGTEPRTTATAAREVVDDFFQKHVFSIDVINALLADTKLNKDIRDAALRIAKARGDNPYALNQEAWAVVQKPGGAAVACALALRKAESAYRADSDHGPIQTTLGAAQYRTGQFQEAVATLKKADQVNQGVPGDLAFLAMAQHQLGRSDEARATLARLREVLKKPEWVNDAMSQAFLREAEELLKVGAPESRP